MCISYLLVQVGSLAVWPTIFYSENGKIKFLSLKPYLHKVHMVLVSPFPAPQIWICKSHSSLLMASFTSLLSSILLLFLLCLTPSPVSASNKVSVSLYYEALCPYCSDFIVNNLAKIFQNGLISIVDLNLVPFGNAVVTSDGSIICQVRSVKYFSFSLNLLRIITLKYVFLFIYILLGSNLL